MVEKAKIDAGQPVMNKKINNVKKQTKLRTKNSAKKEDEDPEPIQLNQPDKMPVKK